MRKLLTVLALLAFVFIPAATAHAKISFSINIGPPPAPLYYRVPARPGPYYDWVEGYWYPDGSRYRWHDGYWARPPYNGAYWVQPYYHGGRYYTGHWDGHHGRRQHDEHREHARGHGHK